MTATKLTLKAEKRTEVGNSAKKLRKENYVLGNIYGKGLESVAVKVLLPEYQKIYRQARGTHVVYLSVGDKEYPSLISNVQRHPITRDVLHVDFRKMDLKQKTETKVPVEIIGELAVVKTGEADLIVLLNEVTVECLPTEIPEKIIIDISKLEGIGSEVKISDLPKAKEYVFMDDESQVVVQVSEAKKEEIVAPVAEEEVAPAAEGTSEAPAAGGLADAKLEPKKE
jgi:large subunit ribosomal protein L25